MLVVGYPGAEGAWSHLAAERHFGTGGGPITYRGYVSFGAMLEAVQAGAIDRALLPIENTTAGSINESYDLLARMDLWIGGEEVQRVEHCLVALAPAPVSSIRRIASHPQALAQCSEFLAGLRDCRIEAFSNTALAIMRVRDDGDASQAAIGSADAARRYGLHVIAEDIANQRENYTRFVVVTARPVPVAGDVPCKTSVLFVTRHERGTLLACLAALADQGLNLTKIESRPRARHPWEYVFYADFEGHVDDPAVARALGDLAARTIDLKVLGSYPARILARQPD